ncbi:MAG: hypothetical protein ACXAD7_11690 [Candidatus Kariarchaeaceae archaeon]|jgi:hypothetical protein
MTSFLFILGFMLVAEVFVVALLLPIALYGTQLMNFMYQKLLLNPQKSYSEDTANILSGLSGNAKDTLETHMRKRES